MNTRNTTLVPIVILLLVAFALAGLTWANYRYTVQYSGGYDFLPRWLGVRLFLMEGQSPYSEQTTQAIQQMIGENPPPLNHDQEMFYYPFYVMLLVAPFSLIPDFQLARALWMTVLEVSLVLLAGSGVSLTRWRLRPVHLLALFLFAALWYHGVSGVINGDVAILVALFVAAALLTVRAEQDGLAGFLLALATSKPQMVILLGVFVIIWGAWRGRWVLVWSFVGSLILLTAATSLFIPDWVVQNLRQVLAIGANPLPGTTGDVLTIWMPGVGSRLGVFITVILSGFLLFEWRAAAGKDFNWFLWAAFVTLAITDLIGIYTALDNFSALLPAFVLIFFTWDEQWGALGRGLVIIFYLLLFPGLWWLALNISQPTGLMEQNLALFFPVPVLTLFGLYWIRWWALRSTQPYLEPRTRRLR